MPMAMYIMGNGMMIKLMEMVSTLIQMGQSTRGNGNQINNTDKEKKAGRMERSMKVNISAGKNMDMESLDGLINLTIWGIS